MGKKYFYHDLESLKSSLDSLKSDQFGFKEKDRVGQVTQLINTIESEAKEIFKRFDSQAHARAVGHANKLESMVLSKLKGQLDSSAKSEVSDAANALVSLMVSLKTINSVVLASTALSFLLGVGITAFIIRRLKGQLDAIRDFAGKVAAGDLNAELSGSFPDELEFVKVEIERMVVNLKQRLGSAQGMLDGISSRFPVLTLSAEGKISFTNKMLLEAYGQSGDFERFKGKDYSYLGVDPVSSPTAESLRSRKPVQSEIVVGSKGNERVLEVNASPIFDVDGNYMGVFSVYYDLTPIKNQQTVIEEKNNLMANIAEDASRETEQAEIEFAELTEQVAETSSGAQRQRARTEETATAMEQMNTAILGVSRNASSAAQNASFARDEAVKGAEMIDHMISSIGDVYMQMELLRKNMSELGDHAKNIDSIITVIEDISDQTNLLALNAAIEAARAGEAGRGFAVVADEVRKLAEKSMEATKDVAQAITNIQSGTSASIDATGDATRSVEDSTKLAEESGRVLGRIVEIVSETAVQVETIATASEEQSAASEEVTHAMDEINRISAETADSMSHANSYIESAGRRAQEVNRLISQLKK